MLTSHRRPHLMSENFASFCLLGLIATQAIASEAPPREPTKIEEQSPIATQASVIFGRVVDEQNVPLADALVRVAIPATDMRFVTRASTHQIAEAKADQDGRYRLELPGIAKPTRVSIDAMKPGYRRLSGTLMEGGRNAVAEARPGGSVEFQLTLSPARYFAGRVVDQQGNPVSGVPIWAASYTSEGSGGIEISATKPDGTFEIFNYHPKPAVWGNGPSKGLIHFEHPDYIAQRLDDIYAIPEKQQVALRIVLDAGFSVSGTVVDTTGKPMANTSVTATRTDGGGRKGTLSDAEGRFILRGLKKGNTKLSAKALALRQRAVLPVGLNADKSDLILHMRAIELPSRTKTWSVLGMQLADGSADLASAYDLHDPRGAVITDPGKDSARFQVGNLETGFNFWMVGERDVASVRDFIQQILNETAGQNQKEYSVRVVYGFSTAETEGSNTQYLKLTSDDLQELRSVLDLIDAEAH